MSVRARAGLAICALVAACATSERDPTAGQTSEQSLAPFAMHEECMSLAAGDRLEYAFSTDAPVAFDIHYHDGAAVVEPITRDRVVDDAGVFAPVLARDYCLMWEAGAAGARLEYRVRVQRAPR